MTTPAPAPVPAAPAQNPGLTFGIIGLVLAILPTLQLFGLIFSLIGRSQSKRVGLGNGPAVAGIIISIIGLIVGIIIAVLAIGGLIQVAQYCAGVGPGVYTEGPVTYTCG